MGAKLLITVQPSMARIDVVDSWMQPKGSGFGKLDLPVLPGVYEVRADSGLGQTASHYCSVREGQELKVPLQVPFFSAAPLPDTVDFREDHARAARDLSNHPKLGEGKPCRLMVFARLLHPMTGVMPTLANLELRDGKRRIDNRWQKAEPHANEGWVGWCGGVDPGGYLLRWLPEEGHPDSAVDQSLWLPKGFTLMVFLGIGKNTTGMPAREFLTLLQAPLATGFNPFDSHATKNLWAMEMALAGWLGRRKYLQEEPQELETLLDEKHENPLLGIVAAHSLWLPRTPNWELLRTLHRHFQRHLRDHPDVLALEAHARARGLWSPESPPSMPRLNWPPMFAASYRLARESPMVVGPETLVGKVAGRLVDSPVWLCWRTNPPKPATGPQPSRDPSAKQAREEKEEVLGTWLTGAMQSVAGLEYLGRALEDEAVAPKTGPRFARKVWRRFARSRDPVLQSLHSAIVAQFGSAWDRQSLGQFRLVSLSNLAAREEIPEEVVAVRVQKVLEPLDDRWPPRRPNEFLQCPRMKNLLEDVVKKEATAQAAEFNLPRVFVEVLSRFRSESGQKEFQEKRFATESDFRDYLADVVRKASGP